MKLKNNSKHINLGATIYGKYARINLDHPGETVGSAIEKVRSSLLPYSQFTEKARRIHTTITIWLED